LLPLIAAWFFLLLGSFRDVTDYQLNICNPLFSQSCWGCKKRPCENFGFCSIDHFY